VVGFLAPLGQPGDGLPRRQGEHLDDRLAVGRVRRLAVEPDAGDQGVRWRAQAELEIGVRVGARRGREELGNSSLQSVTDSML
jgi:hypothetical protein